MTVDVALSCLRELRALERLQRAVQERPAPSFEWQCGAVALRDRIQLLTYCLSVEPQDLLDAVQARYAAELVKAPSRMLDDERDSFGNVPDEWSMPDLPTSSRIH